MDKNSDSKPDSASPGEHQTPERAIDAVLLNALASVVAGKDVLADEASRSIVRETLEDVTSAEDRDRFHEAVGRVHSQGEARGEARRAVADVVDLVREELVDRNAQVIVDHEVPIPIEARDAAVYNFAMNEDPSAISDLDLPPSVASHVQDGADCVGKGDYKAAAQAFTRAVEEAGTGGASVTTRTLAAWANHWAGDDHTAIDFVEEALHLHADGWAPTLPGYSADPDRSFARPEQFRDGKYAAMATLRYTVDCTEGTNITPFLGLSGDNGIEEWVELEGTDECTPIHRLSTDPVLRLRLAGEVPEFPTMHGYYVGLGIVDLEVTEFREVYRLLVDGPIRDSVTETVRVEIDD